MRVKHKGGGRPGFMLAPMIDMTFLLLIFFMVTTKITKDQVKMDIRLPVAANAVSPEDLKDRDIINIDGEGQYYIRNNRTTKEGLADYLKIRFEEYPPLRLYVRADKNTPGKQIKELMDMAAEAGAIDVIFGSYQNE